MKMDSGCQFLQKLLKSNFKSLLDFLYEIRYNIIRSTQSLPEKSVDEINFKEDIDMSRNEMINKYKPVMCVMEQAGEQGDMNVLLDKLIYTNNVNHGRITGTDTYKGVPKPTDAFWLLFEADYQELIK